LLHSRRSELKKQKIHLRYKHIRFFERVKLERQIRSVKKKLASLDDADENAGSTQRKELQDRLEDLQKNLVYVRYYPYGEKYVSILAKGADSDEVLAARERIWERIIAEAKVAGTRTPPGEVGRDQSAAISNSKGGSGQTQDADGDTDDADDEAETSDTPAVDAEDVEEDDFFLHHDAAEDSHELDEDEFDAFLARRGLLEASDVVDRSTGGLNNVGTRPRTKAARDPGALTKRTTRGKGYVGKPARLPHGSSWKAQTEQQGREGDRREGPKTGSEQLKGRRKYSERAKGRGHAFALQQGKDRSIGGKHVVFDTGEGVDRPKARSVRRAAMPVDFQQQKEMFLDHTLSGTPKPGPRRNSSVPSGPIGSVSDPSHPADQGAARSGKRKRKRQTKERRKENKRNSTATET